SSVGLHQWQPRAIGGLLIRLLRSRRCRQRRYRGPKPHLPQTVAGAPSEDTGRARSAAVSLALLSLALLERVQDSYWESGKPRSSELPVLPAYYLRRLGEATPSVPLPQLFCGL